MGISGLEVSVEAGSVLGISGLEVSVGAGCARAICKEVSRVMSKLPTIIKQALEIKKVRFADNFLFILIYL